MLAGLRRLLKLTRTTVVLLLVICTLGFNLLTFAFAPLANLMLSAAHRLAITPALAAASDLATARDGEKSARRRAAKLEAEQRASQSRLVGLRSELDVERQRAAQLDRQVEARDLRLAQLQSDLDLEKHKAARVADELALVRSRLRSATNELNQSRKQVVEVASQLDDLRRTPRLPDATVKQIDSLTNRIVRRSGINATRNLASMPLESVPVVGALTIVSVTALEIYDACQTAVEMQDLRQLASLPDVDDTVVRAACAKVPTLGGFNDITLAQCREHEEKVLAQLGPDAASPIKYKCDCIELPDGCPDEDAETVRVPPPKPVLP